MADAMLTPAVRMVQIPMLSNALVGQATQIQDQARWWYAQVFC